LISTLLGLQVDSDADFTLILLLRKCCRLEYSPQS